MARICITYRREPETDRWVWGDRWLRPVARRILRGPPRPSGLDKVFINLCLGLDRLGIPYAVNKPYRQLRPDDLLGVLGRGRHCLDGYQRREPLVAGIGLMTHPSEWPTLLTDYPVACYLQHSAWADAVYRPYFGDRCQIWPVGIDTVAWQPATRAEEKPVDFLLYDKVRWDQPHWQSTLLDPLRAELKRLGLTHESLPYGHYEPEDYRRLLQRCRAVIYISGHESQGIACQEAMAAGVPVFAWDPGYCLDPERFKWGQPLIPATSVPYFDERCGRRFLDFADFSRQLPLFLETLRGGGYAPRDYILENLTVERCSKQFVRILKEKLT